MPVLDGHAADDVRAAAEALRRGALVAFPTETVYGLGARADDGAAVGAIFAAKGRPADHPLIVHVTDAVAAAHFAPAPGGAATQLMARFWPGPLTLIVPRRADIAAAAAGGQDSIGLRAPAHPVAQALLRAAAALGVPGVAAPSANRFGRVSPTTAAHVAQEFGPTLTVLDGGACPIGIESTIVDCTRDPPALLRPGQLGAAAIEAALGGVRLRVPDGASPRAPGTLASHYAPAARLRLFDDARSLAAAWQSLTPQQRRAVAVYSRLAPEPGGMRAFRPLPAGADEVAHELFAVLRAFDDAGAGQIWVEQPPAGPDWDGVNDRLHRAAAA
ncbi:MAG: L-threonylcarbamoyladenylate synthase [Rubrivivax sp.]